MSAQPRDLLTFSALTPQDLNAVTAIEERTYPYPWTLGNFRDSLAAGHSCWQCCVGQERIGYAIVMLAVDEAHLLNITIAPEWQGLGYGRKFMAHLIKAVRALKARVLLLEVRPSNMAGQNLYVSFGFRAVGLRRGYYPAPVGREDAIVMELKL